MIQILVKNSFLLVTNIFVACATIYSLVATEAGNRQVSNFIFPNQVALNNWTQIHSNSLPSLSDIDSQQEVELIASVKNYQYIQDDLKIDARISYIVNTRGNVKKFIETHIPVSQDALKQYQIKQDKDIGFYSLFHSQDYAYLSSCLTPQSITTVTVKQFSHSLNQIKITPNLLGKWLIGKASIRDRRCLWIHLSIPIQSEVSESHAILENTWIDLVQWWIPNFPQI